MTDQTDLPKGLNYAIIVSEASDLCPNTIEVKEAWGVRLIRPFSDVF